MKVVVVMMGTLGQRVQASDVNGDETDEDDSSEDECVLPAGYTGPGYTPPPPVEIKRVWDSEEKAYLVARRVMRLNERTMLVVPVVEWFYLKSEDEVLPPSAAIPKGVVVGEERPEMEEEPVELRQVEESRVSSVEASRSPESTGRPDESKVEGGDDGDFEVEKEENMEDEDGKKRFLFLFINAVLTCHLQSRRE